MKFINKNKINLHINKCAKFNTSNYCYYWYMYLFLDIQLKNSHPNYILKNYFYMYFFQKDILNKIKHYYK